MFLLGSTLQVDLSFWPHGQFATGAAPVQMLFGQADDTAPAASQDPVDHLRLAWLYALHVRSALARSRHWQALWMLEGIRNELVALYCVRYGLATQEGRGVDQLPGSVRSGLATTLVTTLQLTDLLHGFSTLVALLLSEADRQALPVPAGLGRTLGHLIVSLEALGLEDYRE